MDPRHLLAPASISASRLALASRLLPRAVRGAGPVALRVLRAGLHAWAAAVAAR